VLKHQKNIGVEVLGNFLFMELFGACTVGKIMVQAPSKISMQKTTGFQFF